MCKAATGRQHKKGNRPPHYSGGLPHVKKTTTTMMMMPDELSNLIQDFARPTANTLWERRKAKHENAGGAAVRQEFKNRVEEIEDMVEEMGFNIQTEGGMGRAVLHGME